MSSAYHYLVKLQLGCSSIGPPQFSVLKRKMKYSRSEAWSFSRISRIPHFVGWNCIFLVVLKLERINEEESHIFQKTCPSPVRPQEKMCNWTRWTIVQREGRLASVTLSDREVENWIKIEKNFSDLCAPLYVQNSKDCGAVFGDQLNIFKSFSFGFHCL